MASLCLTRSGWTDAGEAAVRRESYLWSLLHSLNLQWNAGILKIGCFGQGFVFTCGYLGVFQKAHFQQCHQECESGLGSLVFIGSVGMQTISAPTGAGIVEDNLEI